MRSHGIPEAPEAVDSASIGGHGAIVYWFEPRLQLSQDGYVEELYLLLLVYNGITWWVAGKRQDESVRMCGDWDWRAFTIYGGDSEGGIHQIVICIF